MMHSVTRENGEEDNVSKGDESRCLDGIPTMSESTSTMASYPDVSTPTVVTNVTTATERIAQMNINSRHSSGQSGHDSGAGTPFSFAESADGDSDELPTRAVHHNGKEPEIVHSQLIEEERTGRSDSLAHELVEAKVSLASLQEKNEELEKTIRGLQKGSATPTPLHAETSGGEGVSQNKSQLQDAPPSRSRQIRFRGDHTLISAASPDNKGGRQTSSTRIRINQRRSLKRLLRCRGTLHPLYDHELLSKVCTYLRVEEIKRMMSVCSCWHLLPLRDDVLLWETLVSEGEISAKFRQVLWIMMATSGRPAKAPHSASTESLLEGFVPVLRPTTNASLSYPEPTPKTMNVKSPKGDVLYPTQVLVRWRQIPSLKSIKEEIEKVSSSGVRQCIYEQCLISAQKQARMEQLRAEINAAGHSLVELEKEEAAILHSILGHSSHSKNSKSKPPKAESTLQAANDRMLFASSSRVYGGGLGRSSGSADNDMVAAAEAAVAANTKPSTEDKSKKDIAEKGRSKFKSALKHVSSKLRKRQFNRKGADSEEDAGDLMDEKEQDGNVANDDHSEDIDNIMRSKSSGSINLKTKDMNNSKTKDMSNSKSKDMTNLKTKDMTSQGFTLSPEATERWNQLQDQIKKTKDALTSYRNDLQRCTAEAESSLKELAETVNDVYRRQWLGNRNLEEYELPSWINGCAGVCLPLPPWLSQYVTKTGSDDNLDRTVRTFVETKCCPQIQITTDVDRTFGDLAEHAIDELESHAEKGKIKEATDDADYDVETLMDSVCASRKGGDSSNKLGKERRPLETGTAPEVIRLRKSLRNVLLSYSVWDPSISYCQGMNYIAAMLLRVFEGSETLSFHVLAWLMHDKDYNLQSLFSSDLEGLEEHFEIHKHLRQSRLPHLHDHFMKYEISPDMYGASRWFMTQFSSLATFPMPIATLIWDWWIVVGWPAIHGIALAILSEATAELLSRDFMNSIQYLATKLPVAILETTASEEFDPSTLTSQTALRQPYRIWIRAFRRIRQRASSYDISYSKINSLRARVHEMLHAAREEESKEEEEVASHNKPPRKFSSASDREDDRPATMLYTPRSWKKQDHSEQQPSEPASD